MSNVWRHFGVVSTGEGVLLALSEQSSGMLLSILQCTGCLQSVAIPFLSEHGFAVDGYFATSLFHMVMGNLTK
jgi:hypothetical protein